MPTDGNDCEISPCRSMPAIRSSDTSNRYKNVEIDMSELKKRSDNNFPTGNVEHRVPGRLAGRKALVTGASRGIGAEAARAFASEGRQ